MVTKTTKKKVRKKATKTSPEQLAKQKALKKNPKNKTKRTGRPTKYKPEYCEVVKEVMAKGYSKEAVAGHLEIAKDTLYQWEKAHPDFADALKEGVELSRLFWERMGIEHITHFAKSGKQLNSTAWIFNMKNRFNWRDKSEVDLGNKEGEEAFSFNFKLDKKPEHRE